ncbi:MAG: cytochrome b N-terminal domain-containing protein [Candidatus Kapaibacteriota bacterium]
MKITVHTSLEWLLRSVCVCFMLQAFTGALLTLHYEPSLRPAMTESGKPLVMLEIAQSFRYKPTKTLYNAHEILFAEYDTATKAPFYAPDTLRFLSRLLAQSQSNAPHLPNTAYYSVEQGIMRSADFGGLVRGIHAAAANVVLIVLLCWLCVALLSGYYAQIALSHWAAGIMLCALSMGTSILGYILPMNLRSFAALNIVLSTLESIPILGKGLAGALRGASAIAAPTLIRVYVLHILFLPALLLVCWYALRAYAPKREEWAEYCLLSIGIIWFCVVVACAVAPTPLGALGLPADFTQALTTPQRVQPEWYALGFAALLRIIPAWSLSIGGVLWFGIAVSLPILGRYSGAAARAAHWLTSASLLGLVGLTLWELRLLPLPTVTITDEYGEVLIVVSILTFALATTLVVYLRQRSASF